MTAALLAATLSVALPTLGVEIAGAEELVQTETPTREEKPPNAP